MNVRFQEEIEKIPELYQKLIQQPTYPVKASEVPAIAAIYVFYEEGKPVHVGRTRNLKSRVRGHRSLSHYSASFAFKLARNRGGYEKASYTKELSRSALAKGPLKERFTEEIEKVKKMKMKFLKVSNPITQYLLELYAAIEMNTDLKEFDTH